MQVTVSHDYRTRTASVRLHPLPEWRTRVLEPIPVPGSLRGASDLVKHLPEREDFEVRPGERSRALRLVQALASEAERREYKVSKTRGRRKNQWGFFDRNEEDPGHFKLVIGTDEFKLGVHQLTEKREHVASKSELARAGRGYAVPKWDVVPTERLAIKILALGSGFWGSSWEDRPERPLEVVLAQVLQELELRHQAAVERRAQEELDQIERKRQWEIAREKAVQALTDSHRAELLTGQVAKWREVAAIREYAAELEAKALSDPDESRSASALEWVEWARGYADRADPLLRPIRVPAAPELTHAALQPFMGSCARTAGVRAQEMRRSSNGATPDFEPRPNRESDVDTVVACSPIDSDSSVEIHAMPTAIERQLPERLPLKYRLRLGLRVEDLQD